MKRKSKTPATAKPSPRFAGSAPTWYTRDELFEYLKREGWNPDVAHGLCDKYAANLQGAYEKGYDMGRRFQAGQNK